MVEPKRLVKDLHDSTAKGVIAMHASTRTEFWALHLQDLARALEEATRREDEGFWSLGSVGSSNC